MNAGYFSALPRKVWLFKVVWKRYIKFLDFNNIYKVKSKFHGF